MSDQVEDTPIANTEPIAVPSEAPVPPEAFTERPSIISASGQFPQLSPSSSPPSHLITALSILIALGGILTLFSMDYSPLSHTRSDYYLQTISSPTPPLKIRLGSFNIRYAPSGPLKPLRVLKDALMKRKEKDEDKWGERGWEERREKLVDQVMFSELDVVGYQEVLDHQYKDLQGLMGEEFGFVGVGRNDGKKAGEAVPIFYRKSRFSLSSYKHSWLSPTPDIPGSRGWDAGQPRMVTIARLRDLQSPSSDEIIVVNTHWDDRGLEARTNSAKLILELVREEMRESQGNVNGKEPLVVLMGDLNSPAEEKGYQVLTGDRYKKEKGESVEGDKAFWDSRHELATRKTRLGGPGALSSACGPHNTFTGFVPSDTPKIIDFILLFDNAAFVSPHFPLPSSSDASFLDADDPDELSATLSESSLEPLIEEKKDGQTRWKVSRYGVVPNFYEDVGGRREGKDALIVSDHRLVIVALEQIVA